MNFPTVVGKRLECQILCKCFYCETRCSMRAGGRTDGQIYGQPLRT